MKSYKHVIGLKWLFMGTVSILAIKPVTPFVFFDYSGKDINAMCVHKYSTSKHFCKCM